VHNLNYKNEEVMKKVYSYLGFIVFFIIGFFVAEKLNEEISTIKRSKFLLGTIVEIQIRDSDDRKADAVISDAFNEIQRIDKLLSIYDSESSVCKINNSCDSIINIDDAYFSIDELNDEIKELKNEERVEEIARMAGGKVITDTARKHAEEMIMKCSKIS